MMVCRQAFPGARRALALAVTLGAVAAAPAARAQLEEVVITAQRHAQGINDVGITVNAFTGDTLRARGVTTPEDIALLTPGLTVNETAATGVPAYTLRGVGFQDYTTSSSSTVGLYFDEVAIPYTVMSRGTIFDIERVEVLKGPQGDLYGRNTTAGSINFISRKPTEEFEAGILASVGNFETVNAEGYVSGPLGDSVRGRLAFRTEQSGEGWQESLTSSDKLGERDLMSFRGLLDIDLGERGSLLLRAVYVDDQSDNRANTAYDGRLIGINEFSNPYLALADYVLPGGSDFGETPPWYNTSDNDAAGWTNSYTSPITGRTFDIRPQRDNQLTSLSAKLEWDFNAFTLTSITAYDGFEREEANDWDGGFYNDSSNINTTDVDVYTQELRLSGTADRLFWTVGAFYSKDEMDEYYHYFMSESVFGFGSVPFQAAPFFLAPILELDTIYDQETENYSFFGHVEYQFTDAWRLTLGARYTDEERTWSGCTYSADDGSLANFLNTLFGASLGPGDCGTINDIPGTPGYIFDVIGTPNANDAFYPYTDTIETDNVMYKIGLDYSISDDILAYAMFATGFKSGGFNGANSNTTSQLQPIEEEELTSYELGLKSTLLDGTLQLNAAAFYYDYQDKQEQDVAVTFVGNISGLTNIPESEILGAEVELAWLPFDGFSFNGGIAWLDTEVKEWMAVDREASAWPNTVFFDASGIELPQAPEWQYNGTARYEWNVASGLVMFVAGDFTFKDDAPGGPAIEDTTEDYWVYNGRIGVEAADGRWTAMLWSRNITDEYYFPAAYTGGNGPYVRAAGMPRTYGLQLSYTF